MLLRVACAAISLAYTFVSLSNALWWSEQDRGQEKETTARRVQEDEEGRKKKVPVGAKVGE